MRIGFWQNAHMCDVRVARKLKGAMCVRPEKWKVRCACVRPKNPSQLTVVCIWYIFKKYFTQYIPILDVSVSDMSSESLSTLSTLLNIIIAVIWQTFSDVSVSDMNDEEGAGGSSKSNSITSEHSLQSTGISASSQGSSTNSLPKVKNFAQFCPILPQSIWKC